MVHFLIPNSHNPFLSSILHIFRKRENWKHRKVKEKAKMTGHSYRALKVLFFLLSQEWELMGEGRERDKRGRWGLCEGVKEKNLLNNRWIGEVEEEGERRAGGNQTTCCPPLSPLSLTTLRLTSLSVPPSPTYTLLSFYTLIFPSLSSLEYPMVRDMLADVFPLFSSSSQLYIFTFFPPSSWEIESEKLSKFCNYCSWTCDPSLSFSCEFHSELHSYLCSSETILPKMC